MPMALDNFDTELSRLKSTTVRVSDSGAFPELGAASVQLIFSDGSKLRADYWRVIRDGKARDSSFDHKQKYGLPEPIDAIRHLQKELHGRRVSDACLEAKTGDLIFCLEGDVEFQVFNFTGYEVWEILFPNGIGEYSNYAK
jgi:hypothetical protein